MLSELQRARAAKVRSFVESSETIEWDNLPVLLPWQAVFILIRIVVCFRGSSLYKWRHALPAEYRGNGYIQEWRASRVLCLHR